MEFEAVPHQSLAFHCIPYEVLKDPTLNPLSLNVFDDNGIESTWIATYITEDKVWPPSIL